MLHAIAHSSAVIIVSYARHVRLGPTTSVIRQNTGLVPPLMLRLRLKRDKL